MPTKECNASIIKCARSPIKSMPPAATAARWFLPQRQLQYAPHQAWGSQGLTVMLRGATAVPQAAPANRIAVSNLQGQRSHSRFPGTGAIAQELGKVVQARCTAPHAVVQERWAAGPLAIAAPQHAGQVGEAGCAALHAAANKRCIVGVVADAAFEAGVPKNKLQVHM